MSRTKRTAGWGTLLPSLSTRSRIRWRIVVLTASICDIKADPCERVAATAPQHDTLWRQAGSRELWTSNVWTIQNRFSQRYRLIDPCLLCPQLDQLAHRRVYSPAASDKAILPARPGRTALKSRS